MDKEKIYFTEMEFKSLIKKFSDVIPKKPEDLTIREGWVCFECDASEVIKQSNYLKLKSGYRIWNLVHSSNGNARNYPFAMKSDLSFETGIISTDSKLEFKSVLPPEALDYMSAIDGDLSLQSFIEAVAFHQAIESSHCKWHGAFRALSGMTDKKPYDSQYIYKIEPTEWRGKVTHIGTRRTLEYFTSSCRGFCTISMYKYQFRGKTIDGITKRESVGPYVFSYKAHQIAEGGLDVMI